MDDRSRIARKRASSYMLGRRRNRGAPNGVRVSAELTFRASARSNDFRFWLNCKLMSLLGSLECLVHLHGAGHQPHLDERRRY